MPPRAPSLDLLRVLHRSETPLKHAQRLRCPFYRTLTSTRIQHDSKPKPSTHPHTSQHPSSGPTSAGYASKANPYAPRSHDRGPTSKEDTQTDFGVMDIYANIAQPATSIDACTSDGFHLDNGMKITGYAGLLVAGGEAWSWRPWLAMSKPQSQDTSSAEISALLDPRRGILTLPKQSLGLLALLHPKPDLLILGTGARLWMLAPESKKYIMEELGIRIDVMDTGNASAAYNLLAKERGVEGGAGVGGAFLPIGWKGPEVGRRR